MAYRVRNDIALFAEARKINPSRRSTGTGGYAIFADGTANILADSYSGRLTEA